jgi:acetyltransferase-like isoleucine patch superfamily enzyme
VVAKAMLAGSCEIGEGAWVGPGVMILQRVTVGARALVGMGAVVLKDVQEDTTVAGNPARVINAKAGVRDDM